MYSNYNYSPSATSLRFNKSSSIENFYRQATERSQNYEYPIHSPNKDCQACRHEKQRSTIASTNRLQTQERTRNQHPQRDQYYQINNQDELTNLRKTKRFLEDLIQKNKLDFKAAVEKNENKIMELTQVIEGKNTIIDQLERKINMNQLMQQYGSTSLVGTYLGKREQDEQKKATHNLKIKDLLKNIDILSSELENLKETALLDKKKLQDYQSLEPKLKQYEIYAREYESMKLLIHKMQIEKEQTERKHNRAMNELIKKNKYEISEHLTKLDEARGQLHEQTIQIDYKDREIERTRNITAQISQNQFQHLEQLLQEKDEEIQKLQSKLTCIESELTFLKNRYGYLLKLAKNNAQMNQIGSNSDLEEYCIEKIGRHNISNGKESLIGLNLSPIKRR